jgi:hypothetical protein
MNHIISKILENKIFINQPPVLFDIGASGDICSKWKFIAKYSICVAFDADDRDFTTTVSEDKGYKKLFKINRIVSANLEDRRKFYLTNSPHCSSTLMPDYFHLSDWLFSDLFVVENEQVLDSIRLTDALESIGIDYLDWFKVDSQGTDLDLFLSLPSNIRENVLAADFEPGIMDAYIGENKFYDVMKAVENAKMWISNLEIKGTKRINNKLTTIANSLRNSPCWGEITALKMPILNDLRSQLLLIVFSLIECQWGYALEIIEKSEFKESELMIDIRNNILLNVRNDRWYSLIKKIKNKFNVK